MPPGVMIACVQTAAAAIGPAATHVCSTYVSRCVRSSQTNLNGERFSLALSGTKLYTAQIVVFCKDSNVFKLRSGT